MAVPKLLGRAYIKHDGNLLQTKEGASLNVGGVNREPVVGNQVHGYVEKVVAPTVECAITVNASTSLTALAKIDDATITFECDTGQTYVLRNAWLTEPPNMTAGESGGDVKLKFCAMACEELGPAGS